MEQFGLSNIDFDFCHHDFSWLDLLPVRSIGFCSYMLLRIDMQSADLLFFDFRGADLLQANLQKSNLRKAKLQGARLEGAKLQGADLSGAKLLYADFSGAMLDGDTILPPGLSEQIWHLEEPEFEKRGIKSRLWHAEWDLSPFSDSADSFVRVLHCYGGCHIFSHSGTENQQLRAKKLRQAARKLQKDGKIPEGFPQKMRSWLSEVKEDGSHPRDTLPA